ncbi:MAG: hypothetical protein HYR60_07265 [Acidobacteria bacterium]|nr:hypothetical protein [Acidobacteriota bacterium]
MNIKTASVFEIARLIDLQPAGQPGFCILVASPNDGSLVSELRRELEVQAAVPLAVIDAKALSAVALVERLRVTEEPVVLISGLEGWNEKEFVSLDVNRSGLEKGAFVVFRIDLGTVARLLDRAPNLRSVMGTSILIAAPDPSSMSSGEISSRLQQLREHYRMSDQEVVEQAGLGSLPAEPHFVEWLVLLGRSELVR